MREPRTSQPTGSARGAGPKRSAWQDGQYGQLGDSSAATAVAISLIIPAYNEARRLPPYLTAIETHFAQQFAGDYEVIVVDDGSTDDLRNELEAIANHLPQLQVICLPHNRGKGAAVRTGMLAARGELLLFADADGATPIEEERHLRAAISAGADVAVGSRLVDAKDVRRQRTFVRSLVGRAFAAFARWTLRIPLRDTQCGFKMLRGEPGRRLFAAMQEDGYSFDLELLILARRSGYEVAEVPISWADQPGSRMNMWLEMWRMLAAVWRLRRRMNALKNHEETTSLF